MGINSQGVAYNFGQLGSAITDSTTVPLRAPKGMVIIAITSLDDTTAFTADATGLVSVTESGRLAAPEFFNTANAANDTGDTTSTASTSGSSTTLTLGAANSDISVGMIIESMGDNDIPVSLTAPTTVAAYDGATTVTMSAAHNVSSQTVGFFHPNNSTGRGGLTMDNSDTIPAGCTIYGRYSSLLLDAGRVIVYFGK
tara:strand:- start:268 stop:861 length:594 start_codon:yes stop_codon:yes gene_type:complete